ncbi:MAG: murein biosynthesis integral membrane protein MurJ [Desulfovibrio sp.]|nr:murein biosynthesis integral membrane protein MurJ [Desulfovibrio sp.]
MGLAAAALGISVFLSRILGLVRDKVISYYFGAGAEADIYFTAFVAPDFLNYLLAGGYFSITLVPLLARAFAGDERDAWRFFSSAVCWAALAIGLLTLAAWLAAPWIAPLVAPGFSPRDQARLASFLRIILPAQACFLPGACFTALLYHRRQFAVPALSPLVYNACIILAGVAVIYAAPSLGMEGFCWGVPLGAALGSLLLPVLAAKRGGLVFSPHLKHPLMKKVLLLALPLMLGQSIVALDEQFVRIFGSLTGEGGVSLLNYARRIMLVPVGVVAQAAGLASYPFLAALAASGEQERFDGSLNKAVSNTLLVALPLSLCMLVAAEPIMRLIFQQGGFSAGDAGRSGLLLALMLGAVGFWAVQQIVGRAFYARQDTLTPALAGTAATVISLPLYWYGAKGLGAPGVALAGSAGVALYTLILCLAWKRRFGGRGLAGLARKAAAALICCLPPAFAAHLAMSAAGRFFAETSLAGAAVKICVCGLVFAPLYLALCLIFAPFPRAPLHNIWARIRPGAGG